MRIILFSVGLIISSIVFSQQKIVTRAIINTTTNIIAPEEEDVQNIQGTNQGGGMNFRNMLDGEIKSTTYLKNDMMKTTLKSEMGRSIIIRDNNKKLTTTLMEIMGTKTGFQITDDEQAENRKREDSMRQVRRKKDSSIKEMPPRQDIPAEISYTTESKKIAGFNCTKAYIINTRLLGIKDTVVVWYTPEIKLPNLTSTGGLSGFGNMGPTLTGFDKIDGFVMSYEMKMRRNRRIQIDVTKVDLEKEIADKEFDIPKDYEIKPMKEMRNMFGGMGMPRGNQ